MQAPMHQASSKVIMSQELLLLKKLHHITEKTVLEACISSTVITVLFHFSQSFFLVKYNTDNIDLIAGRNV